MIDLLDHLEIARANVAGLSLGGMTAMWLGIHAPERVEKLALLCTSPRMGPPEMWAERIVTVREQGTQAIADTTLKRWLTDAYDDQHAINWLRETFIGDRRRGLRELLPRDPAHGPRPQPRRHLGLRRS